jgi:hypothetical protein
VSAPAPTHTGSPTLSFKAKLPRSVYDEIARLASANERSISGEFRHAIREHIRRERQRAGDSP